MWCGTLMVVRRGATFMSLCRIALYTWRQSGIMRAMSDEWYVNTATGEISQDKGARWTHRLGPYKSKEAAAEWRGQVAARNAEADALDLEWQDKVNDRRPED